MYRGQRTPSGEVGRLDMQTFASLLDRPAFGLCLQRIGASRAYEPSALAIVAFALTWGCLGLIHLVAGASPGAKR